MSAPLSEPTLGEIARSLAELRHDVRAALDERLRSDVYRVEQSIVDRRLTEIEAKMTVAETDRKALRRQMVVAVAAAVLAFVANMGGELLRASGS